MSRHYGTLCAVAFSVKLFLSTSKSLKYKRMDIHTFHRQFNEDFIALYKSLPCLWDTKCKDYTNRKKKSKAYEQLITLQRQVNPNASRDTVVKKINSLRTTYRRERKKVQNSKGSKELYIPNLWYYDMIKFVDDGDQSEDDSNIQYEDEEVLEEYLDEYKQSEVASEKSTKVKQEAINSTSPPLDVHPKKKRRIEKEPIQIFSQKDSLQTSDEDEEPLNSEGRFFHFGKYVAQELDSLPETMAIYCQKLINDAIFEAQLGTLSSHSHIVPK